MKRNSRGFTLLEVMISVIILASISAMTGSAIQRSLAFKRKIQNDIDVESKLKNSMRMIERDLSLAFHYRNLDEELRAELKKAEAKASPGATPPPTSNTEEKPQPKVTQFRGESDSIHLSTLTHIRLAKDIQESNQAGVGYYLNSCSSKVQDASRKSTGKCLFRRETPFLNEKLDENTDKQKPALVMLENVEEFSLKYFGDGKQDWVTSWKTDEGGDEATKDNFPLAVEVLLKVKEFGKNYTISALVPVRFPNNKSKEPDPSESPSPGGNPNPTPTPKPVK